jgi:hypothetical protein
MEPIYFSEEQKFNQAWLWIPFVLQFAVVMVILFLIPNPATWFVITITCGVALLFLIATLRTQVRSDGIYYQFFPFHLRWHRIGVDQITRYTVRTYEPITEYGGWGLRRSRRHGKAYNVKGDVGLQLELTDGKKILFGTQRGEAFKQALDKLKNVPNY